MPPARFLAPAASAPGDRITLPDDEAEHLTRVLRLRPGDHVRVFNGRGAEFEATVEEAGRHGVSLCLGAPHESAPEPIVSITLAQAVLKGDKMDDVVRDAVMIGVAAIRPLLTTRTESSVAAIERGRRHERWTRIAVSSAKQCGRAVIPPILEPVSFPVHTSTSLPAPVVTLVEPGAASGAPLRGLAISVPRAATLLVGPEGGWTPEEVKAAASMGSLVTLGGRTLRADAMALVALSALFAKWGEY